MALNPSPEPAPQLACGRDAALVWDRAAAGEPADEHESHCPHCIAAAADARGLDSLVHRMAQERPEPPPSVLDRVMVAVRTELRPRDVLTLPSPHGPARLSRTAAAAVLRHTVDAMDGVRARSCRIDQVSDTFSGDTFSGDTISGDTISGGTFSGDAIAGEPGHAADVRITVAARFGVDLASVTARVRQMVAAAGEQALGVPVRRVDIEVVDVFGDEW